MSGVARPRGPLPPRVYWTRRAVVLAVAFLLVFGIALVLGDGSDGKSGDRDTAEQAAGSQTPTRTNTTTTTPKATESAKKKRVLAEPDGPCDPADIKVEARVEREANDGEIRIPLALTGKDAACTWTISSRSMVVKIISGDDRIWSSQQCPRLPEQAVVVRSAVATKVVLVWNGRRSDEDCSSASAGFALPGSYHVIAAALGGEPTDVQFLLTRPPTERVTVPPKAKQKSKQASPSGASEPS
jgi:hypothetical protein